MRWLAWLWHRHRWDEFARAYAPAVSLNAIGTKSLHDRTLERFMWGVTTLLWRCPCGEIRHEEVLGQMMRQVSEPIKSVRSSSA